MKDYSRLFEIIQFQEKKYPQQDCLNYKYNGKWRNYSTSEVNSIINNVSKAFLIHWICIYQYLLYRIYRLNTVFLHIQKNHLFLA